MYNAQYTLYIHCKIQCTTYIVQIVHFYNVKCSITGQYTLKHKELYKYEIVHFYDAKCKINVQCTLIQSALCIVK